jgi:hypothetical protein
MVGSGELLVLLMLGGMFGVPLAIGFGLFWWLGTRSNRAMKKGRAQLAEGRVLEAYETFDVCNDKLILRGQASLWLWRLNQARTELDLAASVFEHRDEGLVAPFMALVAAIRDDRDVEPWLVRADARASNAPPEAKLALAIFELRRGRFAEALNAVPPGLDNPRARALGSVLRDWVQVHRTGESRPLDAVAFLGEGGPTELERHWPELTRALRVGRLEPASGAPTPSA